MILPPACLLPTILVFFGSVDISVHPDESLGGVDGGPLANAYVEIFVETRRVGLSG